MVERNAFAQGAAGAGGMDIANAPVSKFGAHLAAIHEREVSDAGALNKLLHEDG